MLTWLLTSPEYCNLPPVDPTGGNVNGRRALLAQANQSSRMNGALLLSAGALILADVALSSPLYSSPGVWGALALTAWCAALITGIASLTGRRGLGLGQWKVGSWFLIWIAVTCGLGPLAPRLGLPAQILPSSIVRAEWLTGIAVTAWAVAYCAGPRKFTVAKAAQFMSRRTSRRSSLVRGPAVPWLLYGTGTVARLTFAALTGRLGYIGDPAAAISSASSYQQALSFAELACPLAITVASLRLFRDRAPGARITLAILFAAEIAAGAFMGQKGQFITVVVAVAIGRAAAGRKLPVGLILGAAAFFMLIVIPFTVAYRSDLRGGIGNLSVGQAAGIAPMLGRAAFGAASPATIAESMIYLGQRLQDIDAPAIVMQKTPSQLPYASPVLLPKSLAAELIPRALWPGKPIIDPGYQFTQQYWGTTLLSYSAITPQADLYRYGGLVTVVMGMLLLGCLMRVADEVLEIGSPHAALLVLLVWPVLATPEGSFVNMLEPLPGLVVLWLAAIAVSFRREPRDESCAASAAPVLPSSPAIRAPAS